MKDKETPSLLCPSLNHSTSEMHVQLREMPDRVASCSLFPGRNHCDCTCSWYHLAKSASA